MDALLSEAQTSAADQITAVETAGNASVAHRETFLSTRTGEINSALEADTTTLDLKYAGINSSLEASKLPQADTLWQLNNAGASASSVPYPEDCVVPVAFAVEQVKAEVSSGEIWTDVVVNGATPARGVNPTFAPTDAPTVSPATASPTTSPVTVSPTFAPTDAPTVSPTRSPTRSPTKSP